MGERGWRCHLCNGLFLGNERRANHMRNYYKADNDPTRCDNVRVAEAAGNPAATAVPLITFANVCDNVVTEAAVPTEVPLITAPVVAACSPLTELARKKPVCWETERETRSCYQIVSPADGFPDARNMIVLQRQWDQHLSQVQGLCSDEFWKIFLQVHVMAGNVIDRTLHAVKNVFVLDRESRKKFPISRRALLTLMKRLGAFWPHVLHTVSIDLSSLNLPSGTRRLEFKFVDPIWGWIMAARRQHPLEMHFKGVAQRPGAEVYGGGIQYGAFLCQACKDIPAGAYPMCIGLHWDGTGARGLESSPICVCVGNTNSCKSETNFCIGYIPHIPDESSPEWAKHSDSTEAKHYVKQQCAKAILAVIEEASARGVRCRLRNQHHHETELVLFAKLSSMNFDQPEAQNFFGLQNKCSCSKCRRRIGFSSLRKCCPHLSDDIRTLYHLANDLTYPHRKTAREKLHRWGFNFQRECCLLQCGESLFVRIPSRLTEVFPGLDYRDRMHGIVIFFHRIFFTLLDDIIKGKRNRQVLDGRLGVVVNRSFRLAGVGIKKQRSIFTDVGMSAADKATVLFLLSHVIGPGPDGIIDAEIHLPLTTAIACTQLVIIASRGRRSYSKQELEIIFDRGFARIFGALETVREINYHRRLRTWARSSSGPAPKRFKRTRKYVSMPLFTSHEKTHA